MSICGAYSMIDHAFFYTLDSILFTTCDYVLVFDIMPFSSDNYVRHSESRFVPIDLW